MPKLQIAATTATKRTSAALIPSASPMPPHSPLIMRFVPERYHRFIPFTPSLHAFIIEVGAFASNGRATVSRLALRRSGRTLSGEGGPSVTKKTPPSRGRASKVFRTINDRAPARRRLPAC